MRVVVIYKEDSEHGTTVDMFLNDFQRQTGRDLETMDPETQEGISLCRTYDVVEYPTIIALSDDSQLQSMWRGLPLPTISEVSYYA
ncbi:hypothetical protein H6796_00795 [Candidatus Nomurabacteria bacterium]|nr:hypothetical protein [Candidatus Nomurabacteria bacterium]